MNPPDEPQSTVQRSMPTSMAKINEKDTGPEIVDDMESASLSPQIYIQGTPEEKTLILKQDMRILPLCCAIYLLCYLDRSNIGNAKVLNAATHNDLLSETHMTNYQFTIALMVFLIAYMVFEVPSNYFLKCLSPSRWIAFLMFSWSVMTMALGGVNNYAAVASLRFLLGVSEAGLFPGLVYYLSEHHCPVKVGQVLMKPWISILVPHR
jgi:sugar phosphate permease